MSNQFTEVIRPCGNINCGCSTGIHDGLTYGSGELDEYGYWEIPCYKCAREGDKRNRNSIAEMIQERIQYHKETKEQALKFLQEHHEWLFIKCWPFAQN